MAFRADYYGERIHNKHSIAVYVDWDDDDDYDDAIEDISAYLISVEWAYGFRNAFEHMAGESEATIILLNSDQRFSPENTTSPLTGNIVPGRKVKITTDHIRTGTVTQYIGFIERVIPSPFSRRPMVTIECTGYKKEFEEIDCHIDLQEDVTADEVITDIITATGLTISKSFDTGRRTFPYVADNWERGIKAYTAIKSVVEAERGHFFFDKDGTATFWNAHKLKFLTAAAEDVGIWSGVDYKYGERIINAVTCRANPRTISAAATDLLWELDSPITIKAGDTRTIRAQYTEESSGQQVGGKDVVDPSGTDLVYTGDLTFTWTHNAASSEIEIENTGDGQGSVETINIKGKMMISRPVEVTAEDSTSIATYGRKRKTLDLPVVATELEAQYVANAIIARQKDAATEIRSVTLEARNDDNLEHMLGWDLGQRVSLVVPQVFHEDDHHVMGARHRWQVGNKHETVFFLEPIHPVNGWLLAVVGRGELGTNTYLG